MILTINDKDYELNFGLKFLKEISKDKTKTQNGIDVRMGIENAVTILYTGDFLILPDLIKACTATLKEKPNAREIEEYLDECENLEKLGDDFLNELLNQSATKKKALPVYKELENSMNPDKK